MFEISTVLIEIFLDFLLRAANIFSWLRAFINKHPVGTHHHVDDLAEWVRAEKRGWVVRRVVRTLRRYTPTTLQLLYWVTNREFSCTEYDKKNTMETKTYTTTSLPIGLNENHAIRYYYFYCRIMIKTPIYQLVFV